MRKLILTAFLAGFPVAAFAGTPSEAVKFFYSPPQYEPDLELRSRFTDPAKALFAANDKLAETEEIGCIDFSPGIDAQDYDDAEIARTLKLAETISGDVATVTATFALFPGADNADAQREMVWSLTRVNEEWLVSDIESRTSAWKLSEFDCEPDN